MAAPVGVALPSGKCETCKSSFNGARFALYHCVKTQRRSCAHLVCGSCRGAMLGWSSNRCPNNTCKAWFYNIEEVVDPRSSSIEDIFKFVNLSGSGRVAKAELESWYTSNFQISKEDASKLIDEKWTTWDVPKNRKFLGFMRSYDMGDLDIEEFPAVRDFMKRAFEPSLPAPAVTEVLPGHSLTSVVATGKADDAMLNGMLLRVQQKTVSRSDELQQRLRERNGQGWFTEFDRDKSGMLEKGEVVTALLQTFMGSHSMTRSVITGIVDGVWDAIDADGGGSVGFDEFQTLREALVAQMESEKL